MALGDPGHTQGAGGEAGGRASRQVLAAAGGRWSAGQKAQSQWQPPRRQRKTILTT
jgi:hypothetical protein